VFVPDRELAQELLAQHAAEPLRQFLQHLERKLGAKAIEGKDIDHKTPARARRTWWQQYGEPARTIASRKPRLGQEALIVQQRNRGECHRGEEHGDDDEANHRTIHHINCSSKSQSEMQGQSGVTKVFMTSS